MTGFVHVCRRVLLSGVAVALLLQKGGSSLSIQPSPPSFSRVSTPVGLTETPHSNSKDQRGILTQTRFILIETRHRGNVGGVARALKTMGFDELVLVKPCDPKVLNRKLTQESASGALHILQEARVCESLAQALEGIDIKCATGMPHGMTTGREQRENEREQHDLDQDSSISVDGDMIEQSHDELRYEEPRRFFDECMNNLQRQQQQLQQQQQQITRTATSSGSDGKNPPATLSIAFVFGSEKYGMRLHDMKECDVVLGIPTNPDFGSLNLASAVQLIAYDWRQALGGF